MAYGASNWLENIKRLSVDSEGTELNYGWIKMQLARRVREMRETRTAASTYAPATRLRKSTNIVDVVPRAEDFIDPLGLGYVYQKHSCVVYISEKAVFRMMPPCFSSPRD